RVSLLNRNHCRHRRQDSFPHPSERRGVQARRNMIGVRLRRNLHGRVEVHLAGRTPMDVVGSPGNAVEWIRIIVLLLGLGVSDHSPGETGLKTGTGPPYWHGGRGGAMPLMAAASSRRARGGGGYRH